jgi:hypothetical protein
VSLSSLESEKGKRLNEDLNKHTNLAKALFSKRNQNKGKKRLTFSFFSHMTFANS